MYNTLTVDADDDAAAQTAQFLTSADAVADIDAVLIPRLRQLETMGLLDIVDGKPSVSAQLGTAVLEGATRAAR